MSGMNIRKEVWWKVVELDKCKLCGLLFEIVKEFIDK